MLVITNSDKANLRQVIVLFTEKFQKASSGFSNVYMRVDMGLDQLCSGIFTVFRKEGHKKFDNIGKIKMGNKRKKRDGGHYKVYSTPRLPGAGCNLEPASYLCILPCVGWLLVNAAGLTVQRKRSAPWRVSSVARLRLFFEFLSTKVPRGKRHTRQAEIIINVQKMIQQ